MSRNGLTLNFLRSSDNDIRKRQSERQEKKIATDLRGTGTIGSGNKGMKGDAHGGDPDAGQRIMAEAKSTNGKSMSIKLAWLDKLVREALQAGMQPVLYLRFEAAQFQGMTDWACVPASRLKELLDLEASVTKVE